jgi:hypothetical protein
VKDSLKIWTATHPSPLMDSFAYDAEATVSASSISVGDPAELGAVKVHPFLESPG